MIYGATGTTGKRLYEGFYYVVGLGMYSVDPVGGVHWLAKPDGRPVEDSYFPLEGGKALKALIDEGQRISTDGE